MILTQTNLKQANQMRKAADAAFKAIGMTQDGALAHKPDQDWISLELPGEPRFLTEGTVQFAAGRVVEAEAQVEGEGSTHYSMTTRGQGEASQVVEYRSSLDWGGSHLSETTVTFDRSGKVLRMKMDQVSLGGKSQQST